MYKTAQKSTLTKASLQVEAASAPKASCWVHSLSQAQFEYGGNGAIWVPHKRN